MENVTTWTSGNRYARNSRVNLTRDMEKALDLVKAWPRDSQGEPLSQVAHGRHWGDPTPLSAWPEILVALVRGAQSLRAGGDIPSAQLIEGEIDEQVVRLEQAADTCGDPHEAELIIEALEALEAAEGSLA